MHIEKIPKWEKDFVWKVCKYSFSLIDSHNLRLFFLILNLTVWCRNEKRCVSANKGKRETERMKQPLQSSSFQIPTHKLRKTLSPLMQKRTLSLSLSPLFKTRLHSQSESLSISFYSALAAQTVDDEIFFSFTTNCFSLWTRARETFFMSNMWREKLRFPLRLINRAFREIVVCLRVW